MTQQEQSYNVALNSLNIATNVVNGLNAELIAKKKQEANINATIYRFKRGGSCSYNLSGNSSIPIWTPTTISVTFDGACAPSYDTMMNWNTNLDGYESQSRAYGIERGGIESRLVNANRDLVSAQQRVDEALEELEAYQIANMSADDRAILSQAEAEAEATRIKAEAEAEIKKIESETTKKVMIFGVVVLVLVIAYVVIKKYS